MAITAQVQVRFAPSTCGWARRSLPGFSVLFLAHLMKAKFMVCTKCMYSSCRGCRVETTPPLSASAPDDETSVVSAVRVPDPLYRITYDSLMRVRWCLSMDIAKINVSYIFYPDLSSFSWEVVILTPVADESRMLIALELVLIGPEKWWRLRPTISLIINKAPCLYHSSVRVYGVHTCKTLLFSSCLTLFDDTSTTSLFLCFASSNSTLRCNSFACQI